LLDADQHPTAIDGGCRQANDLADAQALALRQTPYGSEDRVGEALHGQHLTDTAPHSHMTTVIVARRRNGDSDLDGKIKALSSLVAVFSSDQWVTAS